MEDAQRPHRLSEASRLAWPAAALAKRASVGRHGGPEASAAWGQGPSTVDQGPEEPLAHIREPPPAPAAPGPRTATISLNQWSQTADVGRLAEWESCTGIKGASRADAPGCMRCLDDGREMTPSWPTKAVDASICGTGRWVHEMQSEKPPSYAKVRRSASE
ncbi:hypothetical protein IQ07DRAFT_643758 [Pyrenochaeta sp. DS3sAY3a]|nr:hypothetical protein IQ07DRAFT_643758 [Pyrenochaeta sp. DS3sAY3a]